MLSFIFSLLFLMDATQVLDDFDDEELNNSVSKKTVCKMFDFVLF